MVRWQCRPMELVVVMPYPRTRDPKPLLRHYHDDPRGQNNTWYLITRWPTETYQHIFCVRTIEMWRALVSRLSRRAVNHSIHGPPSALLPRGTENLGMIKTLTTHTNQITCYTNIIKSKSNIINVDFYKLDKKYVR